jgi:hypothetical protein
MAHARAVILSLAVLLLAPAGLSAQGATPPPALSDAAKLKIIALQQQIEIYRLREQLATAELKKAMDAAQVPGYRLTNQLTYEPVEPQTPEPKPATNAP